MKYEIEITETITKRYFFEVKATSAEEARKLAREGKAQPMGDEQEKSEIQVIARKIEEL